MRKWSTKSGGSGRKNSTTAGKVSVCMWTETVYTRMWCSIDAPFRRRPALMVRLCVAIYCAPILVPRPDTTIEEGKRVDLVSAPFLLPYFPPHCFMQRTNGWLVSGSKAPDAFREGTKMDAVVVTHLLPRRRNAFTVRARCIAQKKQKNAPRR